MLGIATGRRQCTYSCWFAGLFLLFLFSQSSTRAFLFFFYFLPRLSSLSRMIMATLDENAGRTSSLPTITPDNIGCDRWLHLQRGNLIIAVCLEKCRIVSLSGRVSHYQGGSGRIWVQVWDFCLSGDGDAVARATPLEHARDDARSRPETPGVCAAAALPAALFCMPWRRCSWSPAGADE